MMGSYVFLLVCLSIFLTQSRVDATSDVVQQIPTIKGCNGTVSYSEWSLCECLPSLNVTCGGNATRWRSIRNCSEPSCICAYEVEACNKPCPDNTTKCHWRGWLDWSGCIYEGNVTCGTGMKSRLSKDCNCENHGRVDDQYCGMKQVHIQRCFTACSGTCKDAQGRNITLNSSSDIPMKGDDRAAFITSIESSTEFELQLKLNGAIKKTISTQGELDPPHYVDQIIFEPSISVSVPTAVITYCELFRDDWSSWSNCIPEYNQTCHQNGTRYRTRNCFGEANYTDNRQVPTHFCPGVVKQQEICDVPCYNWSEWYHHACAGECGKEDRTRNLTRRCFADIQGYPDNSSKCDGADRKVVNCEPCYVLTKWSSWNQEELDDGSIERHRKRHCFKHFSARNKSSVSSSHCNAIVHQNIEISQWSSWSVCDSPCGLNQTINQTRTCKQGAVLITSQELCGVSLLNTKNCPPKPCRYNLTYDAKLCDIVCGQGYYTYQNPICRTADTGVRVDLHLCNVTEQNVSHTEICSAQRPCIITYTVSTVNTSQCIRGSCGKGIQHFRNRCSANYPNGTQAITQLNKCQLAGNETFSKSCEAAVECKQEGIWSEWSSFAECSRSCGGGKRTAYRICTSDGCVGESSKTQDCKPQPCPIDSKLSEWSEWSQCSVSCGGGLETTERHCTPPKFGGRECAESNLTANRTCNEQKCSGYYQADSNTESCTEVCGKNKLHCWYAFEEIKSLATAQEKFRTFCNTVKSKMNRISYYPVVNESNNECIIFMPGKENPAFKCNNTEDIPDTLKRICNCKQSRDITHGPWTSWSDCSKSCGAGHRTRFRSCIKNTCNNRMQHVHSVESQVGNCGTTCPLAGGWSNWGPWWECNATCGGGWKRRERSCTNPIPMYGGEKCVGNSVHQEECGFGICPTHGNFSEWGQWQHCEQTCGPGNQTRRRFCNNPRPQDGGADCFGRSVEKRPCEDFSNCSVVNVRLTLEICNNEKLRSLIGSDGGGGDEIQPNTRAFYDLENWIKESVQKLYPTRTVRITLHNARRIVDACKGSTWKKDTL